MGSAFQKQHGRFLIGFGWVALSYGADGSSLVQIAICNWCWEGMSWQALRSHCRIQAAATSDSTRTVADFFPCFATDAPWDTMGEWSAKQTAVGSCSTVLGELRPLPGSKLVLARPKTSVPRREPRT